MPRPHVARIAEDVWNTALGTVLQTRGWRPLVIGHTGYGGPGFLRILARVLLAPRPDGDRPPHQERMDSQLERRGWRNFVTAEALGAPVTIEVAGETVRTRADHSGNLDLRIPNPGLPPGWGEVRLRADGGGETVTARVRVVADDEEFGIVSDIDDTVIRTYLPRPLIAAYNAFVVSEGSRKPVPGMAGLFTELLAEHPGAPTIYLSTGAWNTAPTLVRFLARHGYPAGPLLMTDWGPTNTGWFRSGQEHKRTALRRLAEDFPRMRWLLVGDDGQHDPALYAEFARAHPDQVRAIAIRQLAAGEQVLAHGSTTSRDDPDGPPPGVPEVRAPDGQGLAEKLRGLW